MNTEKIALLIDGDNAQPKLLDAILTEAGKQGKVTIRRIYGDWTSSNMNGWKKLLNSFAIRPMQKFSFTKGKNSTDTAMIIDAMDILHSKLVSGFCIVSSDSDYTGLANRLREEGLFVMGIGEASKTTEAFVKACELFVFTENLGLEEEQDNLNQPAETNDGKTESREISKTENKRSRGSAAAGRNERTGIKSKITKKPLDLNIIKTAFEMVLQENELSYLGEIGIALRKLDPGFDPRTYGFSTLTSMFKSLSDNYELVYKDNGSSLFIKQKRPELNLNQ